jgi:carboxypeptidase Taq
MAAAQLMTVAVKQTQGMKTAMGLGDLSPLVNWLHINIHAHANLLSFNDLLKAATGKPLDPNDFQAHLRARYLS